MNVSATATVDAYDALWGSGDVEGLCRVVDGDRAVSLYTFELTGAQVPMAEAFEVRNARIARVDLYFDPTLAGRSRRPAEV